MEEYMNEHGCRLILAESKDSFAKHLDDSSDNILSIMDIRNIHIVCDCLIQFLQDNVELDNRAGIEKICHSAVRLMPDIEMVKTNSSSVHVFNYNHFIRKDRFQL